MELVKQVEVNIDYILFLVQQMQGDRADIAELTIQINKAIDSSPDLRDKKDLINRFIESLTPDSEVTDKWKEYVDAEKRKEFERIVSEEHLKEGPAKEFIRDRLGARLRARGWFGVERHHATYQSIRPERQPRGQAAKGTW